MEQLAHTKGVRRETIGTLRKPAGEAAERLLGSINKHLSSRTAWCVQGHGKEYTAPVFKQLLSQDTNDLPEQYDVPVFRIEGS